MMAMFRVIQRSQYLGFALEAVPQAGVVRDVRGEHLKGDRASQSRIAGAVDLAHAAATDRRHDFIRTQVYPGLKHRLDCHSLPSRRHRHGTTDEAIDRRPFSEIAGVSVRHQERLDVVPRRVIVPTRLVEVAGAFLRRPVHRRLEHPLHAIPPGRRRSFVAPPSRRHPTIQPGARALPFARHRGARQRQDGRYLLLRHAAEVPQLNDLRLPCVQP